MLDDLPGTIDGMTEWVKQFHAIDQYLPMQDKIFLAHPVVATQKELISQEDEIYQVRFTLGDQKNR